MHRNHNALNGVHIFLYNCNIQLLAAYTCSLLYYHTVARLHDKTVILRDFSSPPRLESSTDSTKTGLQHPMSFSE